MLITASCWFYTLFIFDTLGDAVNFSGAYWVLIVMPLMPLVLYGIYYLCSEYVSVSVSVSSTVAVSGSDPAVVPVAVQPVLEMARPINMTNILISILIQF